MAMSTPEAARRIHDGRCLTGFTDDEGDVAGWPEVAYESIRAINHLTFGGAIPAPLLYEILGNLKGVGHMLPQALTQLGEGLLRSLDEFEVYDNDGEPRANATRAAHQLMEAAEHAARLGDLLEAAQTTINAQGYRDGEDD